MDYEYTTDWFSSHIPLWKGVLSTHHPARILEVGSYEGRSTVFLIEECSKYANVEITCVDTWEGGVEHVGTDFLAVEKRFDSNVDKAIEDSKKSGNTVDILKVKSESFMGLSMLLCEGVRNFDLVYIDGSHMPSDVLLDATLGFKLLKVGGVLIFDDYRRSDQKEYEHPQIAVDAFMAVYANKLNEINFKIKTKSGECDTRGQSILYQKYLLKVVE